MDKTLHFTTACETFSMTLSMFIYILLQWKDLSEKIISKYLRINLTIRHPNDVLDYLFSTVFISHNAKMCGKAAMSAKEM